MTQEEHNAMFKTLGILLKIKRKITQIESTNKEQIYNLAKQVVEALFDNPTERQKNDFVKQLQHQNFLDTFSVLSIDLPTFSNDVNRIIEESLNQAIINVVEGKDITQTTFAQIVETYRATSYMLGYLSPWKMAAYYYQKKIKEIKIWNSYIEYIIERTASENKKSYAVCKNLLQQAATASPKVTLMEVDLNPTLGYDTTEGVPEDYSHFLSRLDAASIKWVKFGHDQGSEKYIEAEKPLHFDGVV